MSFKCNQQLQAPRRTIFIRVSYFTFAALCMFLHDFSLADGGGLHPWRSRGLRWGLCAVREF
jgi:hypothetical protein